jgi:hypothetical protein
VGHQSTLGRIMDETKPSVSEGWNPPPPNTQPVGNVTSQALLGIQAIIRLVGRKSMKLL